MRIIAGSRKGRKLKPVNIPGIRPTSDRVREAVFSILYQTVVEANVADLFAGTGAMGMEALSRGAAHCLFVEGNPKALSLINENLKHMDLEKNSQSVRWDAMKNLQCLKRTGLKFDLIFADPPYALNAVEDVLQVLAESDALNPEAVVVFESAANQEVVEKTNAFELTDQRKYGKTLVSFFRFML
ncbi:16S rRNA (guanine(966)-N(2))-methyltransferase RsmD [Desulfatibacillum alkenivorans DSM 16219]|jgi:16S rRNA (guanine966-N2)-methyltransferase|uniref:16S rRNA (Guanine(966)-N(2))-methyltransferase RsmD n=1 Tax=Desulfatibacillum alkenivorans DSM 16219 TaxID=1121393 RepID=A0A1M6HUP2_9BACT|nr:16S rRNA (guanine(966)-N(2))-methyltransferase RsmD [Desulfatibacillum alkenivorans]SHJ25828.1 16S rRNA (guanine(966)-N(2))-methyltransferase RsmD [Desulfatibacillum alkenivorans DSM 16219]